LLIRIFTKKGLVVDFLMDKFIFVHRKLSAIHFPANRYHLNTLD